MDVDLLARVARRRYCYRNSFRPSVRHSNDPRLSGSRCRNTFHITQYSNICSFSAPIMESWVLDPNKGVAIESPPSKAVIWTITAFGKFGKRCEIRCSSVVFCNTKSYTGFPLVLKSVTLNDLYRGVMAIIFYHFTKRSSFRGRLVRLTKCILSATEIQRKDSKDLW